MFNFVLAESALELVPKEIWKSREVASDSKRRGTEPSGMLLDRSFHESAMPALKDSEKRGRPDLVHVALLSITGTPLYLEGKARVFVHTYNDVVLEVEEKTRLPKHYLRFRGLMEQVLTELPSKGLVRAYPMKFQELVSEKAAADRVLGLSVQGKSVSVSEFAEEAGASQNPCVIIGGFPHGHFSKDVLSSLDGLFRIDSRPLEAHVVASRVAYEIEKAAGRTNH